MTTRAPLTYTPATGVKVPNLDPFFGPDAPTLPDPEPMPDAMLQNPYILHVMQILDDIRGSRPGVFVDTNTIVYYDPSDRNNRFQPDVYVAFDVDAAAIRRRNGYLIWEVGKAPDFALEVASESTSDNDTGYKRDLYARVGIGEYWRFDPSEDAGLYGRRLVGERLENGAWHPLQMHTDADGTVWGYSPMLNLNLRGQAGRLDLQDPDTGEILLDRRGVRLAMEATAEQLEATAEQRDATAEQRDAAVEQRDAAVEQRDAAVEQRDAALAANADYREQVRRLQERLREHGEEPG